MDHSEFPLTSSPFLGEGGGVTWATFLNVALLKNEQFPRKLKNTSESRRFLTKVKNAEFDEFGQLVKTPTLRKSEKLTGLNKTWFYLISFRLNNYKNIFFVAVASPRT